MCVCVCVCVWEGGREGGKKWASRYPLPSPHRTHSTLLECVRFAERGFDPEKFAEEEKEQEFFDQLGRRRVKLKVGASSLCILNGAEQR